MSYKGPTLQNWELVQYDTSHSTEVKPISCDPKIKNDICFIIIACVRANNLLGTFKLILNYSHLNVK